MKIDGVFSGGGVKAFAFIGVLEVLEERNFSFDRVAGTSAGAIVAGLLAAGYTSKELKKMFTELDLAQFMDGTILEKYLPFWKWLSVYFTMGLYKGKIFEEWLYQTLARKNIYTFRDLPKDSLKVVVADISEGKIVVIPDDLERLYGIHPDSFLVSKAIRMSASLPYFFRPEKLYSKTTGKSIIVDGAILSNLPMWVFEKDRSLRKRPLLGVKLSASYEQIPKKTISNALDLSRALITTMRIAHDTRYVSKKHKEDILFLPVNEVDVSELELSREAKDDLIKLGRTRAISFLTHWPN
ncbi:hypothetical protein GCM10011351_27820 [Paraliobacillus quinghaiensis]|uniref:PNPLA domain-containing protein n=1 Tax=Paraliobacillus quinghaiensis TaxID=470815 RepID=A0A917WWT0_9BACI|nr:patatin-like phospholipase family protein [Paraliobacillus quinghaiensis]GGM40141.1 hypothetical protein GCM10011351_27820 [Paraliobacillus quinghaiensis]